MAGLEGRRLLRQPLFARTWVPLATSSGGDCSFTLMRLLRKKALVRVLRVIPFMCYIAIVVLKIVECKYRYSYMC